MKVHEILIEAPKDPKGVVFEIFVKMLPDEITKASLKQIDDALRWLAKTAKSNPTVAEDIASSLVAGSKQMGISVREMAQMAEPHLLRVGIDPADIQRAKSIAEKLAEPSMWQKFKDAVGLGAKKEKPAATRTEPTLNPTPSPTTPTPSPTTPTPTTPSPTTPTPTTPSPTTPTPGSGRIASIGSAIQKFNPSLWRWWQTADAIAMAYGIIEPWYTFKQRADLAIAEFAEGKKNPDGSLKWADKPGDPKGTELSKGVQIAAQEAMAQMGALLAGRKLIGFFSGANKLRALPDKTREQVAQLYSSLGAQGQVAFAAWLDSPPGRRAFDGWLWGQMYNQPGAKDENPPLATSVDSVQGNIAWALRRVSSMAGGLVKSFYDDARRAAGQIDSQGNDAAAATQKQQAAKDSLPNSGGVLNTTTEK